MTSAPRRGATLPFVLSAGLGLATILAAAPTLFRPGVLQGPAVMNGSAQGTALVALFVATPVLAAGMTAAARGWEPAPLLWLGATAYLLYNAFLFLFATPFNQLFLAYLAMSSLAGWTLVSVLRHTDIEALGAHLRSRVPARAVALFAWLVVLLNAVAWLLRVVPAVLSTQPSGLLTGTGLTTIPTYIQDLAFWLPLAAVAAAWLWQRRAWGYIGVGTILTMWVLESIGVAVDQWLGSAADPASSVASAAMTPAFLVVALITMIPLWFFYRPGARR